MRSLKNVNKKNHFILIVGILFLCMFIAAFSFAQEKTEKETSKAEKTLKDEKAAPKAGETVAEKAVIDKKAEEILKKVSDFYAAKKSMQFNMIQETKSDMARQPNDNKRDFTVIAEKPNKFSMKIADNSQMTIGDGKKWYNYRGRNKEYTEKDSPADFDSFLNDDKNIESFGRFNVNMYIIISLLTKNPYEALSKKIEKIEYKGQEEAAGAKLEHIKIMSKARDFDVWIKSGDNPVIVKVVPDMEKMMRSQGREPRGKIEITVSIDNWKFDEKIAAETFIYTPGKEDKKVEGFRQGFGGGRPEGQRPPQNDEKKPPEPEKKK